MVALVAEPHGLLRERDLDAGGVERFLHPEPDLALDRPLHRRLGLDHQADGDAARAEVLDAPDLGTLHQFVATPFGVFPHLVGDPLDDALGVAKVDVVGDFDVDEGPRPQLAVVADPS